MRTTDLSELKKNLIEDEVGKTEPSTPDDTRPKGPVLDSLGRAYATGKRKTAVARLWLKSGAGRMTINGREKAAYFPQPLLQTLIEQPFKLIDVLGRFDVMCTVKGSGLSGQAGAIRHALARALALYKPDTRSQLKREGFLTLDARQVERKKYGQAKARKRYQRSKR